MFVKIFIVVVRHFVSRELTFATYCMNLCFNKISFTTPTYFCYLLSSVYFQKLVLCRCNAFDICYIYIFFRMNLKIPEKLATSQKVKKMQLLEIFFIYRTLNLRGEAQKIGFQDLPER